MNRIGWNFAFFVGVGLVWNAARHPDYTWSDAVGVSAVSAVITMALIGLVRLAWE